MAKNLISGDTTTIIESGNDIAVDLNEDYKDTVDSVGSVGSLETTDKTSLVNAINEVYDRTVDDSGWITLTPTKGTWNVLRLRKIGDIVYIEGDATAYTWSGSAETFATIPEGYRPAWHKYIYGFSSGKTLSRLYVATGGGLGVDWLININGATNNTSQVWFRFYAVYATA